MNSYSSAYYIAKIYLVDEPLSPLVVMKFPMIALKASPVLLRAAEWNSESTEPKSTL